MNLHLSLFSGFSTGLICTLYLFSVVVVIINVNVVIYIYIYIYIYMCARARKELINLSVGINFCYLMLYSSYYSRES
jgi:hypothetical protein